MAEKKREDFVVSDRRRFGAEGETRTDVPAREDEQAEKAAEPAAPAVKPPERATQAAVPSPSEAAQTTENEVPAPPTAAEQKEQHEAYSASSKKLEDLINKSAGERRQSLPEMTFERLVESFYMTALIQLGAIRQEGDPPAVDIIGARQTIDSLNILQDKTKGNLTDREQSLLQNVLFELRMAWIEVTNALAGAAAAKSGAGVTPDKK